MSHKLGICIPYRNRKEHLDKLIPHLSNHLTNKGIEHMFYVGHQVDDKLFNRGAMKNIAAHYAFEDGCDYVAWHDVDMLAFDESDYSYPNDTPIHIATKLSKYEYGMNYIQYFGGVVLFNKEQAYQTNGYSNNYWDWGQEDDDLFWRCHFENYTSNNVYKSYKNKLVANFNGENSFIEIPTNRDISGCLNNSHTVSILFRAEQQTEKVPIWLVGDKERKFVEYPILRKSGSWTWGLSFNNSRSVNMMIFDRTNRQYYNYAKRYEKEWTWVTMSFNYETKEVFFFLNDKLITTVNGLVHEGPFLVYNHLKLQDSLKPFLLGFCNHTNTYFKGKISEIKIHNDVICDIEEIFNCDERLVLHVDFNDGFVNNINKDNCEYENVELTTEDIDVIDSFIPFRRDSRFDCLPHIDEGFVEGRWAKGETTARNEKRFVTEMQQGKVDYKNDGLQNILDVMDIESIDETLYPKTKFINVKMR